MRISCLVNNYNYRRFVNEAVDSALQQRRPFDEILVVDDGSTDDSVDFLRRRYASEQRVKVVAKPNGGQLSAFNEGYRQATGDLLFFLDADDVYRPGYTEHAVAAYEAGKGDFIVAGMENFGPRAAEQAQRWSATCRTLGYSLIRTLLTQGFYGGPTSSLSFRRSVAERILPYPYESDWVTRADDVLTLGASLVGAKKHMLAGQDVGYRHHGANLFSCVRASNEMTYRHAVARNRLFAWYVEREGYDINQLTQQLHREFTTIERPTIRELREYIRHSLGARLSVKLRMRQLTQMLRHFMSEKRHSEQKGPYVKTAPESCVVATKSRNRAA